MTKQEWARVEAELSSPYGSIKLICDGYELLLHATLVKRRLMIGFFVDDHWKGKWMLEDCEHRRRFFRRTEKSLWNAKSKASLKKAGKKLLKSIGMDPEEKIVSYSSHWPSFRPLKAHLIKNNTSIELAPEKNL